jgi:hypothetical protein
MRTRHLAWALPALLALAAAPSAWGEGEEEGFSFHPSIELSPVYDDEPSLHQLGGQDDAEVGFWMRPGVELGYRRPALDLRGDFGVDVRRYVDFELLDDEFWYALTSAEVGLVPGLTARFANDFTPHYIQLGQPEDHGLNLAQTNRSDAELRYWRDLGNGREVELGTRGSYFHSERFSAGFPSAGGPTVDPSYRPDFWQTTAFVESRAPLGREVTSRMSAEYGYRDFRDGARADHQNAAMTVGLVATPVEGLEIQLDAGYGAILFDGLRDVHQPLGRFALDATLPAGFAWHTAVENAFRSNLRGNEVIEASGEVGLTKQFGERVDASAEVFAARFEDRGAASNLYGGFEAELGWDMAEQTRLALRYRHWRNRGDAGFDDLTQNVLFLTFRFRH